MATPHVDRPNSTPPQCEGAGRFGTARRARGRVYDGLKSDS
eukprot:CAMPEP_0181501910 /NCGR_PEP_ID=MMETSP1110-20121109/56058_1 /TAXON_ID=174948 /ORGANISM="Symbiodinium sp., Strain CCMP421" /LENGTH=40 /DNA_ID= /DNA_START= /DNA_END= /DNA_ORIENTATION=